MKRKLLLLLCALLTMIGVQNVKADGYTDYINEANGWTQVTDNAGIATDGSAVYAIVASEFGLAVGIPDEGSASQLTYQTVSGQPTRTQVWSIESDTYGSGGYALKNLGNREKYVQAETGSWDMHANSDSKNIAKTCYQFSINDGTLYIQTNNDIYTDTGGRYWGDWSVGTHVNGSSLAGNKAEADRVTFKLYKKILSVPGQDYTFLLANPSFETGDKTGWTDDSSTNDKFFVQNNDAFSKKQGTYYAERYWWDNTSDINQTTLELPAGIYRITAAAMDNAASPTFKLYAKAGSSDEVTQTVGAADDYSVEVSLKTAGTIKLGFRGTHTHAQWVAVDNFRLTYLGDASANMAVNATAKWGTFCAPFAVAIPSGVTAYTCESATSGVLNLEEVATTIPANTPVILNAESGLVSTTFYGKKVANGSDDLIASGLLRGNVSTSTKDVPNDGTAYLLQLHGDKVGFYKANGTGYLIGSNRCYLVKNLSGAREAFFFEDDATAISALEAAKAEDGALKDGKYLIDGKIVIVKNGVKYSANGQKLN